MKLRQRLARDIRGWDAIADHRTGTVGDTTTARWLAQEVRGAGAEPKLNGFPFERKVLHQCFVESAGQRVEGVPLFDGGYTDEQGVQARLETLDAGSGIGITPFGPAPGHPGTQALDHARRNAAHKAIVAVAAGDVVRPGLALLNANLYKTPFGPPVLQIATKHRDWLERAANARQSARLVARVTVESTRASNVQTTITGMQPDLAPVVIMTPRSAWWTCTAERAGGIAIWLESLRYFAAHPVDRTLIFTATTGHELGHVGLDHYLKQQPDFVSGAHAWVHLGANFAAAEGKVRYQASNDVLLTLGLTALEREHMSDPDVTPVGDRPRGEARNISDGDGTYVSLLGSNGLFHHPEDRWPEAVDMDKTLRLSRAMLHIIQHLART